VIEKKLSEVDYVVYMLDCHKQRRVCHVNMIKEYKDPSSPSVIPVANVVGLKDDSVVTEEPVGAEVKLKNSDVLVNLDTNLSVEERYHDRVD